MSAPVRRALRLTLLSVAVGAAGCRQPAQAAGTTTVQEFVAAARAASFRYQSQDSATADGFHRVGDDFPSMGEHWVNLARIMADSFAASRPTVLTYIQVHGEPRLAGVAYTALLTRGEEPPPFPAARGHWHEHNGSIAEESFLKGHDIHAATGDLRLSILHAWIWIDNPDGVFTTDNWALPFARLELAPARPTHDAARAAALATDAAAFYRDALDAVLSPSRDERARYEAVLERSTLAADSILRPARPRGTVTAAEADRLAGLWTVLWSDMVTALPDRASVLRGLERRLSD